MDLAIEAILDGDNFKLDFYRAVCHHTEPLINQYAFGPTPLTYERYLEFFRCQNFARDARTKAAYQEYLVVHAYLHKTPD